MELVSEHRCFDGVQRFYRHDSAVIGLPMRFAVYLPPQARHGVVPGLFYLAGLTCSEETFAIKGGAQRLAAELGLALIMPDTSPRGANLPGEADSWDFGVGAGFYLDAEREPWRAHYRMESYIVDELRGLVTSALPIDGERLGICGHSMGGHGALTLALRHPEVFRSMSALAPVCAPLQCPWGQKALAGYLGENKAGWSEHDATELLRSRGARFPAGILVDQGLDDRFLAEQLKPELLEAVCREVGQPLTLRYHAGYDHGYYFVASFIADHLQHHARALLPG
jgi:S-formylglutathione hydrolase